jgi:hypothetical protein
MKKVVLILPDKITRIAGTSRSVYKSEVDLTEEDLIKVLCIDDYHSRYKFSPKDVKVVSIEDYH